MIEARPTGPGPQAAYAAWASLRAPSRTLTPVGATTLRPLRGGTAAYRLAGAAQDGGDVIAKWTSRATVEFEAGLYTEVLPALPVATVRCYGSAPDRDEAMGWLFLEDAGGAPYSPARPEHRRLAARWLAALHTALPAPPRRGVLPARDTDDYRALLEQCGRAITDALGDAASGAEHLPALRVTAARIETLLEHWPEVERLCAGMPRTLVHADFVPKNVRLQERRGRTTLCAFDWENAAWGPPAIDLAAIDLPEYGRCVRGVWPAFGLSDLRIVAHVGRLLWFTSCLVWEFCAFDSDSVRHLTRNLPVYAREADAAMGELGWS